MMVDYGRSLFKGTAHYYTQYRPMYPATLIRFLVQRLSLDGSGNMLDLGCGTGQLTLRFADWFDKIIGVDQEPEMIAEAKRLSYVSRIDNTDWFNGDLEAFQKQNQQQFSLVIIAKAFHWMDREKVLSCLYEMLPDQGVIAIIGSFSPNQEVLPWQSKLSEVVKHWYGNERRAGNTTYSHPETSHEEVIKASKFELECYQLPAYQQVWTVETIIGNLYSTSYGAKRHLGDKSDAFEKHLAHELFALNSSGIFSEKIKTSILFAIKK